MDIEAEMERLSREARAKLEADAPRAAGEDERLDAELAELQGELAPRREAARATRADEDEDEDDAEGFPWEKLLLVVGALFVLSVVWALVKQLIAMLPVVLVVGALCWGGWKLLGRRRSARE